MSISSTSQSLTQGTCFPFTCEECNSNNIIETNYGYSCGECGLIIEIPRLEYSMPYNIQFIQHASLNNTQIGLKQERFQIQNSRRYERLYKINSMKVNEENIKTRAKVEINRIFEALSLPFNDKEKVMNSFTYLRAQILRRTKYRSPEKLVPLALYFTYKSESKPIDEQALLEISKISKEDFQSFKLQIYKYVPKYQKRNRKKYIIRQIMDITEHFGLEMYFYYQSKKILDKLWSIIKNTKDNVITGLITSISALCLPKQPVTVSNICKKLNIQQSTIHRQVEKNIFERFKIPDFKSLVKSAPLIKSMLVDFFSIEFLQDFQDLEVIIEIKLGNAKQVLNKDCYSNLYFDYLKTQLTNLKIFSNICPLRFLDFHPSIDCYNYYSKLDILKYYFPRGPPYYLDF